MLWQRHYSGGDTLPLMSSSLTEKTVSYRKKIRVGRTEKNFFNFFMILADLGVHGSMNTVTTRAILAHQL